MPDLCLLAYLHLFAILAGNISPDSNMNITTVKQFRNLIGDLVIRLNNKIKFLSKHQFKQDGY